MQKSLSLFGIIILFLFYGCGGDSSSSSSSSNNSYKEAAGGKYYGGVFRINETEYFRSLYPLNVTEVIGHRITNQLYEGLVKLNHTDLSVLPGLAERWDVSDDAKKYTFYIRKGVTYHDDPCFPNGKGREVKAQDFKYVLDKLCEADVNNQGYNFVKDRILGAPAYFKSTQDKKPLAGGVQGIKVVDDYTLTVELSQPFGSFLHLLAMPFGFAFPKEAFDKYGKEMRAKAVGTGPFMIKTIKDDQAVVMVKNPKYWGKDKDGNQLPYLDAIKYTFYKQEKASLLQFEQGKYDMKYRLPVELTDEIVTRDGKLTEKYSDYQLQRMPTMSVYYYGFQNKSELFKNKKLRQAFNYAIDRKKLTDFTLKGQGMPANNGIVPPIFPGFSGNAVKGYKFNPQKARQLLAEAGYPEGKGFPKLVHQINSGGGRNEQVAEATQKMLSENLNIDVSIEVRPFDQHLEIVETGKSLFWRAGWNADYPDPENFLNLLYGDHIPATMAERSYINSMRYDSPEFNQVFKKALATVDPVERNNLYKQADQIAMDDAGFLPLFYYMDIRLLQPWVRNCPQNGMEYREFSEVYMVPH